MSNIEYAFMSLPEAPLVVDAIYKGGPYKNVKDDPISKLLPGVGNQGGIRPARKRTDSSQFAYVAIFTSNGEIEWPDYLDAETGIFRYYGDNRNAGSDIHDTKRRGNLLLKDTFDKLHDGRYDEVPPFFLFEKTNTGRDVRFLGLAAPGSNKISSDRDIVSFWRTLDGKRFQNYEAYFTVLDMGNEVVTQEWIHALLDDTPNKNALAPKCWKRFVKHGREGIKPLQAAVIRKAPSKQQQLPQDEVGLQMLDQIHRYYSEEPYRFEAFACRIVQMMDQNFAEFELTRPWRDGGRDAMGKYRIGPSEHSLVVECALEAKCYGLKNSVGVREMSRLISRIKYRQFGIMVTTSVVNKQAYDEVLEDGHPILILTGVDIYRILREHGVTKESLYDWLKAIEDPR